MEVDEFSGRELETGRLGRADPIRLIEIAVGDRVAGGPRGKNDPLATDIDRAGRNQEIQGMSRRRGVQNRWRARLDQADCKAVVGSSARTNDVQRISFDPTVDDVLQGIEVAVDNDAALLRDDPRVIIVPIAW